MKKYKKPQRYIHYGSKEFNMSHMYPPRENFPTKPSSGLWASRVDEKFGWKEWCESEDFRTDTLDKFFTFQLSPSAKVLTVKSHKDIDPYLVQNPFSHLYRDINFDRIMSEYDAMELIMDFNYTDLSFIFYLWDVNSIVVFNLDKVTKVRSNSY